MQFLKIYPKVSSFGQLKNPPDQQTCGGPSQPNYMNKLQRLHLNVPRSTEPAVSNMHARMHALCRVSTPEPTLVPKLFATSFAPMPKESTKETNSATITRPT